MGPFYTVLFFSYIFALLARLVSNKMNKPSIFYTLIVIAILALFSGLRWGIGDTPFYVHTYNLLGPGFNAEGYEKGFLLIMQILKKISANPQFMIFVLGVVTTSLNIWIMRQYSACFELSVFMYITSGFYLVTMNGLRQCLAAAFLFTGTYLIIKGKFKAYLLLVLLMTTIHSTAIVMIPLYFIARMEPWSKSIYIVLGVFLIGLFFYEPMMQILSQVNDKAAVYSESTEGGANIVRVAVYIVPVIFSYLKREELSKVWPESNIFVNISLVNLMIMLFSLYNWIFARFNIYTQVYTFVLLPYIIIKCLNGKERRLIYYGLLSAYFVFFIFEYKISMNIVYTTNFKLFNFIY
ncbi:EpsG family protein [Clostridium sp. NSJ-145]|uniref:EpsG family protein n=1 Tax=Clostridium sp. NSJ-145 TaxID=2897777 RepID=UPI001E65775D|nr:EpsG family protein [Clostridium sp. NSJ-145]